MKKYVAEFFGTFWLVLGGCGSAVLAAAFPNVGIGLLGVALAFGLTVIVFTKEPKDFERQSNNQNPHSFNPTSRETIHEPQFLYLITPELQSSM